MLDLLIRHAYALMIPISLVEGPLVALAGGVGAASGRINPYWTYAIVMGGALFQDVAYYWLGRWAVGSQRVRAFAARMRLIREGLEPLETVWREEMFQTLAASKLAYGLYAPIIVSAGVAKAPYWPFLWQSLALSAVVLGAWLAAGFGMTRVYGALGGAANAVAIGLGVLAVAGLYLIGQSARARLRKRGAGVRNSSDHS